MKTRISLALGLLALAGAAGAQQQQAQQQRQQQEMNRLGDEALRNGQGQGQGINIPRRVEPIPERYGAIAVNDSLTWATAGSDVYYDYAKKDAVDACNKADPSGKGCYTLISYANTCMAAVAGIDIESKKIIHWFPESSKNSMEEAIGIATMNCFEYERSGPPHQCRMVTAQCVFPEVPKKKKGFWHL